MCFRMLPAADVGGNISDEDVTQGKIVLRGPAVRVPSAQNILDPGMGRVGVVVSVCVVHRDDTGDDVGPGISDIVRGYGNTTCALD